MAFMLHLSRRVVLRNTKVAAGSLTSQWKVPRTKLPIGLTLARGFATEPGESIIFKSKFLADPKTVSVRLSRFPCSENYQVTNLGVDHWLSV